MLKTGPNLRSLPERGCLDQRRCDSLKLFLPGAGAAFYRAAAAKPRIVAQTLQCAVPRRICVIGRINHFSGACASVLQAQRRAMIARDARTSHLARIDWLSAPQNRGSTLGSAPTGCPVAWPWLSAAFLAAAVPLRFLDQGGRGGGGSVHTQSKQALHACEPTRTRARTLVASSRCRRRPFLRLRAEAQRHVVCFVLERG